MSKVRVGLLVDSHKVPLWAFKMIDLIISGGHSQLVLVIQNNADIQTRNILSKSIQSFNHALFGLHSRIDRKIFKAHPDAFELTDIRPLIGDATILPVLPISTNFSDRLKDEDLEIIASHDLDVIIRLGFKILRGGILKAAKFGIWSFHHGDSKVNRGGPAGVWEVLEGWGDTGAVLQILTEDLDGGIILDRTFGKTDEKSINRNNNTSYWKALSMIPRNLKKLHALGGEKFMAQVTSQNADPYFYYNKLHLTPTNAEIFQLNAKKILSKIGSTLTNIIYKRQWILMYSLSKTEKVSQSFYRFKKIFPPRDRFWADPFVIFKDDLYYIFFEELLYKTNKGHISFLTIDTAGKVTEPVKVLEKDFHLSYPFVFEHKGEYYMIPETEGNRTIELYKSMDFPFKWELQNTLMENVFAVDTTVHFYDGKFWMFCNMRENVGASHLDELFIFYSDDLQSNNWKPHAMNPVVSDVNRARPAGKIFEHNGQMYRPAQNSSKHYGRGMHIGRIVTLNESEYVEETVQYIYPNWDKRLNSTHTLNFDKRLTIIDGLYKRRKF